MSLPLAASLPNGRVMPRARGEGARKRERGTFLLKGKTATPPPLSSGGEGGRLAVFCPSPSPGPRKKKKTIPFLIAPRRFAQQIHFLTSNFLERRCLRAKYEPYLPSLPPAFSAFFSSSYHEKNKSFVHIFFFCEGGAPHSSSPPIHQPPAPPP